MRSREFFWYNRTSCDLGSWPSARAQKPLHHMPAYPSGQRGQTVNLLANAYVGSNPSAGTKRKTHQMVGFSFIAGMDEKRGTRSSEHQIYCEPERVNPSAADLFREFSGKHVLQPD